MEKRYPREHFTKVLNKICEALDSQSTLPIHWKRRAPLKDGLADVTIATVWVVGSYARGAVDCGDLDVVVEAQATQDGRKYQLPPGSTMAKKFFKSPVDVRFYWGTPDENSSGVPFSEAVIIWQDKKIDWFQAINAILIDPNAGRYYREIDQIPFKMEQLNMFSDEVEHIISLRSENVIKWRFEAFATEMNATPQTKKEIRFANEVKSYCGQQTQKLLPYLLYLFKDRESSQFGNWEPYIMIKTEFRHGGTTIIVGVPSVSVDSLDDLSTYELAIIPHIKKRWPNGVWFIQRGKNHPLYVQLNKSQLFYLVDQQNNHLECSGANINEYGQRLLSLVLYKNHQSAEARAQIENNIRNENNSNFIEVKQIDTEDLLRIISFINVLELDEKKYFFNRKFGVSSDDSLSTEDIIDLLAK